MIKQLGQENVLCPIAIQARLKQYFPNIGQSGTFISDEDIMLTAHNKAECEKESREKFGVDDDYHKEGE
jgi:hypothetical protein